MTSHLVLYDAECGLCDRSVQWLLARDRRRVLTFAPLQGETARALGVDRSALDTMKLVETDTTGRRTYERSTAFFRILAAIGGPWRVVSWLRVLPAVVTDVPYRIVARNRVRWFGRAAACAVPDPSRFLV